MTMDVAYQDTRNLIYHTVSQFIKKKGYGDFEEMVCVANMAFVQAYQRFDGTKKVKFSTWLRLWVWTELQEYIRRNAIRHSRYKPISKEPQLRKRFDARRLQTEVSEDAATVLGLLFESPYEMYKASQLRKLLTEFLGSLGWGQGRIKQSFQEIQEAL